MTSETSRPALKCDLFAHVHSRIAPSIQEDRGDCLRYHCRAKPHKHDGWSNQCLPYLVSCDQGSAMRNRQEDGLVVYQADDWQAKSCTRYLRSVLWYCAQDLMVGRAFKSLVERLLKHM